MKIYTHFHGILADWVGTSSASFDLPADSTLADLMAEIGLRYQHNMPEPLWDRERNSFHRQVRAQGKNSAFINPNLPLSDEAEISFMMMLAGG